MELNLLLFQKVIRIGFSWSLESKTKQTVSCVIYVVNSIFMPISKLQLCLENPFMDGKLDHHITSTGQYKSMFKNHSSFFSDEACLKIFHKFIVFLSDHYCLSVTWLVFFW